jgi:hypothetical protein
LERDTYRKYRRYRCEQKKSTRAQENIRQDDSDLSGVKKKRGERSFEDQKFRKNRVRKEKSKDGVRTSVSNDLVGFLTFQRLLKASTTFGVVESSNKLWFFSESWNHSQFKQLSMSSPINTQSVTPGSEASSSSSSTPSVSSPSSSVESKTSHTPQSSSSSWSASLLLQAILAEKKKENWRFKVLLLQDFLFFILVPTLSLRFFLRQFSAISSNG